MLSVTQRSAMYTLCRIVARTWTKKKVLHGFPSSPCLPLSTVGNLFARMASTYTATIETSGRRGAGIHSSVYIQLVGEDASSDIMEIEPPNGVSFSRGSSVVVPLKSKCDLGNLKQVKVGHTNIGTGSGWLLQNIDIVDEHKNKFSFPCGHFIDGQTDLYDLKTTLPLHNSNASLDKDKGKILGLLCGGYTIQSQDKDICEDSFTYIDRYKAKGNGFHLLGVADGVHIENENSKEYGHQLLKGSERMGMINYDSVYSVVDEFGIVDPVECVKLVKGDIDKNTQGSCTFGFHILNRYSHILHTLIIGDIGIMVIREGTVFYRSTEQQHYFGCPYQLSSKGNDQPEDGVIRSIHLMAGDIVVCGSDGIFDNLHDDLLVSYIWGFRHVPLDIMCKYLCEMAQKVAVDPAADTPWSRVATQNLDLVYRGGKMDDCTLVVAKVVSEKAK